jgi:predicted Zn-dependent protease
VATTTATSLAETQSLGEKDEIQIGNTLYGRIVDSQGGYYRNAAVQAEMERFAAPLIATVQRQHLPWEIVVLDNNEVNAWALPGVKLGVDKGLLRYCASETISSLLSAMRSAMPISATASPRSAPCVSARP